MTQYHYNFSYFGYPFHSQATDGNISVVLKYLDKIETNESYYFGMFCDKQNSVYFMPIHRNKELNRFHLYGVSKLDTIFFKHLDQPCLPYIFTGELTYLKAGFEMKMSELNNLVQDENNRRRATKMISRRDEPWGLNK